MRRKTHAAIAPLLASALLLAARPTVAAQAQADADKTLGQDSCAQCHLAQNRWWFADYHYRSANNLLKRDPNYVNVIRNYEVPVERALLPEGPCARCHATVLSGREELPIRGGVSCESCHGPAGRWLEPHKAGDKSAGRERAGFVSALAAGLVDLENADVLAATCTRCHYITDRKLVAAGHTSGRTFDYAKGLVTIRHWDDRLRIAPEVIAAAFRKRFDELGALPAESISRRPASGDDTPVGSVFVLQRQRSAPAVRPAEERRCPTLDLPAFPARAAVGSIEERLLQLAERLHLLYRKSQKAC